MGYNYKIFVLDNNNNILYQSDENSGTCSMLDFKFWHKNKYINQYIDLKHIYEYNSSYVISKNKIIRLKEKYDLKDNLNHIKNNINGMISFNDIYHYVDLLNNINKNDGTYDEIIYFVNLLEEYHGDKIMITIYV